MCPFIYLKTFDKKTGNQKTDRDPIMSRISLKERQCHGAHELESNHSTVNSVENVQSGPFDKNSKSIGEECETERNKQASVIKAMHRSDNRRRHRDSLFESSCIVGRSCLHIPKSLSQHISRFFVEDLLALKHYARAEDH